MRVQLPTCKKERKKRKDGERKEAKKQRYKDGKKWRNILRSLFNPGPLPPLQEAHARHSVLQI